MTEFKDTIEELIEKLRTATSSAEEAKNSASEAQGYAEAACGEAESAENEIDEVIAALGELDSPEAELTDDQRDRIFSAVIRAVEGAVSTAVREVIDNL